MRTTSFALASWLFVVSAAGAQTEAWRLYGNCTDPGIGTSLASLPDLNGDGVPDFVAGGPSVYSGGIGHALVGSGADGSILFDLAGVPHEEFGTAVARAGDVDGDGVDDVAIGAPGIGNGVVYIHSGSTGARLRTLSGPLAGSRFGASIADLGDVDGDGIRDLAIGAPLDSSSGLTLGLAEIVSGASGAVIAKWTGAAGSGQFGSVVADAADFDGDGLHDVLVVEQNVGGDGELSIYSSATLQQLLHLQLAGSFQYWTASSAGDVNGDGTPDVIVGNPSWPSSSYTPSGCDWVYDGATGALIRSYLSYLVSGGSVAGVGDIDGDGFDDYAFLTWPGYYGVTVFSGFSGAAIAVAPGLFTHVGHGEDVNGDGVPEILIGDPSNGALGGAAMVFDPVAQQYLTFTYGTSRVDHLGGSSALLDDVNGDGTRDLLVSEGMQGYYVGFARVLSGVDGSELRTHPGAIPDDLYATCVAALPDIDGDGIGEYAITAPQSYPNKGFVEIRSGATGTLLNTLVPPAGGSLSFGLSCAVAIQPSGLVELAVGSPLYGGKGEVIVFDVATGNVVTSAVSSVTGERFGANVAYLGDVDGDGVGDWIGGAPNYTNNHGEAIVFSGQSGSTIRTLRGPGGMAFFGTATAGPGDLDGDGVPDVLVSAPYEPAPTGPGVVHLYSGATWTELRSWVGTGYQQFGASLAVVGDLNRDGFDDFLVGRRGISAALLYSGGSGGLLYTFEAALPNDSLGAPLAAVAAPGSQGSMNGDSIPDVAINSPGDTTNGKGSGRLSLYYLDDLYLQITPASASAGQNVTLATSGGPAGTLDGLFLVGLDGTPLFQLATVGNSNSQGIWIVSGSVPAGLAGHTLTFEAATVGFTGNLAITQQMTLTLQ